jgi:hypothetical protein
VVFCHACKMGWRIVSKRLGSRYRSGHSPDWLEFKNPEAPAVRREAGRGLGHGAPMTTLPQALAQSGNDLAGGHARD